MKSKCCGKEARICLIDRAEYVSVCGKCNEPCETVEEPQRKYHYKGEYTVFHDKKTTCSFCEPQPWEVNNYEDLVGSKYFFRTVTYHLVGEVKKIVGRFAYLKNASWIADSGRFNEAIKNGTLSEVEPVGDAFVNLDTVVDFFPWKHSLPKEVK